MQKNIITTLEVKIKELKKKDLHIYDTDTVLGIGYKNRHLGELLAYEDILKEIKEEQAEKIYNDSDNELGISDEYSKAFGEDSYAFKR